MFSIKTIVHLYVYNKICSLARINTAMSRKQSSLNIGHAGSSSYPIVWVDMEMTGLDYKKDKIMEIACVITDVQLNIMQQGPSVVFHQPDDVLNNMNAWCAKQHGLTGLTEECRASAISLQQGEEIIMNFLQKHVPRDKCPLAGNSVYMDRLFLIEHLPKIHNFLHYRIIDVSTVKELCRRWNENVYNSAPRKGLNHRALDDVKESIKELQHYKQLVFDLNK